MRQGNELPTFDEITARLADTAGDVLAAATDAGVAEHPFGEDLFYTRSTEAYLGDVACVGQLASKVDDYDTIVVPGE